MCQCTYIVYWHIFYMIMAHYKNIFFDLDDTLWHFSENAEDSFREVFFKHGLNHYFDSFEQFYSIYQKRNKELWVEYGNGDITKEELNRQRFSYPLRTVGIDDETLAKKYSDDFFAIIPLKSKLIPGAKEVLDYLSSGGYRLFILSNGFRELQFQKMKSAGIDGYFKKVILSEDIHVHKPYPEIFNFALSATQSRLQDSLMVGDSWEADIEGAKGVGMHQMYFNYLKRSDLPFKPTYKIDALTEILALL